MNSSYFTNEHIESIRSGRTPLTTEEREFLLEDTPLQQECYYTSEQLGELSDQELITAANAAWPNYPKRMY